jgi:hypothetical protein
MQKHDSVVPSSTTNGPVHIGFPKPQPRVSSDGQSGTAAVNPHRQLLAPARLESAGRAAVQAA